MPEYPIISVNALCVKADWVNPQVFRLERLAAGTAAHHLTSQPCSLNGFLPSFLFRLRDGASRGIYGILTAIPQEGSMQRTVDHRAIGGSIEKSRSP